MDYMLDRPKVEPTSVGQTLGPDEQPVHRSYTRNRDAHVSIYDTVKGNLVDLSIPLQTVGRALQSLLPRTPESHVRIIWVDFVGEPKARDVEAVESICGFYDIDRSFYRCQLSVDGKEGLFPPALPLRDSCFRAEFPGSRARVSAMFFKEEAVGDGPERTTGEGSVPVVTRVAYT